MCARKFRTAVFFFIFSHYFKFTSSVKINDFHVPEVIKHRTSVVLDCDFSVGEKEEDLVIKWFFNKNNQSLVYQWIPASRNAPQVSGILKDRGNLEKAVDDKRRNQAIHILDVGPDLSGNYTCSVSTMQGEDSRTKSMLVFVPEKLLEIKLLKAPPGSIKIQCIAEGVFPSPELKLSSQKRDLGKTEITSNQRGNLYDISVSAMLKALEEPEEFSCELRIPQANYTVKKETVIYPGNSGVNLDTSYFITLPAIIIVFCESIRQH